MIERTFSLAMLFRATTMIALALGWWVLISSASAIWTFITIMLVMTILATIVGYRRRGNPYVRLWAMLFFIFGGTSIAIHSSFVAQLVQAVWTPIRSGHARNEIDEARLFAFTVFSLPVLIVILVFMFRSWTWAAHDQTDPD